MNQSDLEKAFDSHLYETRRAARLADGGRQRAESSPPDHSRRADAHGEVHGHGPVEFGELTSSRLVSYCG